MQNKLRLAMLVYVGGTTTRAIIRATKGLAPAAKADALITERGKR